LETSCLSTTELTKKRKKQRIDRCYHTFIACSSISALSAYSKPLVQRDECIVGESSTLRATAAKDDREANGKYSLI